ncbi:MAG: RMD1 family protein [Clostridiales bacterium]|nr:RMD1 family protein [Clostridiales bacterium]
MFYEFKASFISNEINLYKIANYFGINKKFKWEEPLILDERNLKGILSHPNNKYVYVYHFGSIVSANLTFHEQRDVIEYLKKIDNTLKNNTIFNYIEDFRLVIDKNKDEELSYDSITVNVFKPYYMEIVATILAKSVALKKIEVDIDNLLDEIENIIVYLDNGKLHLSDTHLAKMSSKVLRFKYNTISYIMLLDKPDVAWKIEDAEEFFTKLSDLFELKDRYDKIRHKTEVLLDITEVFTSLTHAKRGTKLEWMVIILFIVEIVMSILEKIF